MAEMFALEPDVEKSVHPHALKRLKEWKADIILEVPKVGLISEDELNKDVNKYLSLDEQNKFSKSQNEVETWLRRCVNIRNDNSGEPYDVSVIKPMFEIKKLLKIIYERKEQTIKDECEKQEENERRNAAIEALSPPISDAKMYLDHEECGEFEKSIPGAVDAYLKHKKEDNIDSRSFNYRSLCSTIQIRKERKELQKAAESKAQKYNRSLMKEIDKLKSSLHPEEQNIRQYFKKQAVDPRYLGYNFSDLLIEEQEQNLMISVRKVINTKAKELISDNFKNIIDWKYRTYLFLLPSANYSYDRLPCLDFIFDAFAVIEVEIFVKPGHIIFGDYKFHLCWVDHDSEHHASLPTELKDPDLLGYAYYLIMPSVFDCIFWQTIPLSLIKNLMDGEIELESSTILKASEDEIVYKVEGYKNDVRISSKFTNYLKQLGGIDKMCDVGIISKKVASIVKGKLEKQIVEEKASLIINQQNIQRVYTTGNKTKKAMAYRFFKKGKMPGSPEVRALGMHKSTRYKYYRQWEADGKP